MTNELFQAAITLRGSVQLIRDGGREPIERDTLDNVVRVPTLQ